MEDRSSDALHGSGHTTSVWMPDADLPRYPALARDAQCDVCIVGAGISGLTTAYLLGKAGRHVVVLDGGAVGGGETGRTTAHIATSNDDYYHEVERVHGEHAARLAAESFVSAVNRVEYIVREEGIDCDFERLDGYWFLAPGDSPDLLDTELAAAHRAGLVDTERVAALPITSFDTGPGLRFPRQAQFHPLKYLAGLARAVERTGGEIFCDTHVVEVEDGAPCRVRTRDGRTIMAADVVVATNSPVNDRVEMHTKQAPYRTYAIAARVPRGAVPPGLYWDTADPYHYVRLQQDHVEGHDESGGSDLLIVGGEDHKTGQADDADDRFRRLEEWTRERFPTVEAVEYRWSGQVMEPVDHLAFIGRNPRDEHVYIATGDSGNGMTHGTIAGILLTDLITGRDNMWTKLYDPSRKSLRTLPEFIKENVNVAVQYADYLTRPEAASADDIAPGEGAVLRRGATRVAVYRRDDGTVVERSAICPHLYCVVHFNSAEKSWDCPCHGSRFSVDGEVLAGPAVEPLGEAEPES